MIDAEQTNEEAKAIAVEHSKPGNFSFVERLSGRNYPTEQLDVYLDEAAGYKLMKLELELIAARDANQAELIEKQIDYLREKAQDSRYTIHLEGISTEEYDAVVGKAQAEYPIEYRESRNPLTLAAERFAVENDDRDHYFRIHSWAKFIRKIEDAKGNVDENITPELTASILNALPLAGLGRLQVAIDKLRMVTDWMDKLQGDDFLAKS